MRIVIIILAMLCIAGPSMARQLDAATLERAKASCTGDALRYCASSIPDHNAIGRCLHANKSVLTPACRAIVIELSK